MRKTAPQPRTYESVPFLVAADNDITLEEGEVSEKVVYKVGDKVVALRLVNEAPNVVHEAEGSFFLNREGEKIWKIFRIDDVRRVNGISEYRVVWWRPKGKMFVSWQQMKYLEGHIDNIKLVLQWDVKRRQGSQQSFASFAKSQNEWGRQLIAANDRNNCMFAAFKQALKLLGLPLDGVDECIDHFVCESLEAFDVDLDQGSTWPMFQKFLKVVIIKKKLVKLGYSELLKNIHKSGEHRVVAIFNYQLQDGVYLVAAVNSTFVAHCFALLVVDGKYFVVEDDEASPLEDYGEWIFQTIFIRKMVVYK